MPKFCRNCGSMLEEGAKFCANCGTPCSQVSTPEPQPAPEPEYQPALQPGWQSAVSSDAVTVETPANPYAVSERPSYQTESPYQPEQPYQQPQQSPWLTPDQASPYGAVPPQPPVQKKSKTGLIIALIAAAVVVIAGVVLLIVLNPFDSKDSSKDNDSTVAATEPGSVVTPTQPENNITPTQPSPTFAPSRPSTTLGGGGRSSIQQVLDDMVAIDMSANPDVDTYMELVYDYTFCTDSEGRDDLYTWVVEYYENNDLRAQYEADYGSNVQVTATLKETEPCTGDDLADSLAFLEDECGCTVDSIEEIVKGTYLYTITGSDGSDESEYYFYFIKANGKWYYSEYL